MPNCHSRPSKRSAIDFSVALGFAVALAVLYTGRVLGADVPKSKDHPLVSRYPGATIVQYREVNYDALDFRLGRQQNGGWKTATLEGKITRVTYHVPGTRSALEVFRNYEQGWKKAGFETLFQCAAKECGFRYRDLQRLFVLTSQFGVFREYDERAELDTQRYAAARLQKPGSDVHIAVFVMNSYSGQLETFLDAPSKGGVFVQLDIVESTILESGLITMNADAITRSIADTGHAAIYGIYFDTNETVIKPESQPALKEIATALQKDPALRLEVVGHTDFVGTFEFNLDLSRRRAEAVVHALVSQYRIAGTRLAAHGVAYLAPIGSNRTDEGRAQNRRVELVERQ